MEPLTPEPPPVGPYDGLSAFQEGGGDVSGFLTGLQQADQELPTATRPGTLLSGRSKQLQVKLKEEDRVVLARELCQILDEYDLGHRDKWERESEIRDAYHMQANTEQSGSFPDAARMCSEMIMTMVDQGYARLHAAIDQAKPLIRIDPVRGAYSGPESAMELAEKAETFLNPYIQEEMDFNHLLPSALHRLSKVGTAVFRVIWSEEQESRWEWPPTGGSAVEVVTPYGRVDAQLIDNRLVKVWPPDIVNWQRGYTFVGYESVLSPAKWREAIAQYSIPEDLAAKMAVSSSSDRVNKVSSDEAARLGIRANQLNDENLLKPQTLTELWCNMVLPGGKSAEKFQVVLHRESQTILWIGRNAHHSGKHPFFPLRYKWNDGHCWGSGIGDEVLQMWAADTAMFNLMLDSLYAGGFFAILRRAGSIYNVQSDSPRPGMQIPVDDVDKDFKTVKLGGEVPELEAARADNYQRARTASGFSSVSAGAADPVMKSGASSGGIQALIGQSDIKTSLINANIRSDLNGLFLHVLELIQQYGQEGVVAKYATADEMGVLQELLYQPPRGSISRLLRLRVEAPSATSTNEARAQKAMLVWNFAMTHVNVVSGYVTQILQQQNPAALPRWNETVAQYLTFIAQKVAETAELPGVAEMVPQIPEMQPADQTINQQAAQIGQLQQELQQAQQMLQTLAQQGADMCQFADPMQAIDQAASAPAAGSGEEQGEGQDGSQGMMQGDPNMMQSAGGFDGQPS